MLEIISHQLIDLIFTNYIICLSRRFKTYFEMGLKQIKSKNWRNEFVNIVKGQAGSSVSLRHSESSVAKSSSV